MKHKNITFSIPEDLKAVLYTHIERRGISRFITDAIRKALADEAALKEQALDAAYEEANRDEDRLDVLREWNAQDDVADLMNENEDWTWLTKGPIEQKKKLKHG